MNGRKRHFGFAVVALGLLGFLWATTPGLGGMAELGSKARLTLGSAEGGTDPANGDGQVSIVTPGKTFTKTTTGGDTVGTILAALAVDINLEASLLADAGTCSGGPNDGGFCSPACESTIDACLGFPCVPDAGFSLGEIEVRKSNCEELSGIGIDNSDSGLGLVSASRKNEGGKLWVRAVTEAPGGGTAEVIVDVNGDVVAQVTTGAVGVCSGGARDGDPCEQGDPLYDCPGGTCQVDVTAANVNNMLVTELQGHGFNAKLMNDLIQVGNGDSVSWEDNDTGITTIGATTAPGALIPTLSDWGLVLLIGALGTLGWLRMRRRRSHARA